MGCPPRPGLGPGSRFSCEERTGHRPANGRTASATARPQLLARSAKRSEDCTPEGVQHTKKSEAPGQARGGGKDST